MLLPKAIFVCAGHGIGPNGGPDSGATGNGTTERKEVIEIARETVHRLKIDSTFDGVAIIGIGIETPLSVVEKIKTVGDYMITNKLSFSDTILIDVHLNSASATARGIEVWYGMNGDSEDFAKTIAEYVSGATSIPLRTNPVMPSNKNRLGGLGILDNTLPRACLVECGFVTNELDAAVIKNEKLDDAFSEGIVRGIRAFFGLPLDFDSKGFRDVRETDYFSKPALWAKELGIVDGGNDGMLRPNDPATRAEVLTMLYRYDNARKTS